MIPICKYDSLGIVFTKLLADEIVKNKQCEFSALLDKLSWRLKGLIQLSDKELAAKIDEFTKLIIIGVDEDNAKDTLLFFDDISLDKCSIHYFPLSALQNTDCLLKTVEQYVNLFILQTELLRSYLSISELSKVLRPVISTLFSDFSLLLHTRDMKFEEQEAFTHDYYNLEKKRFDLKCFRRFGAVELYPEFEVEPSSNYILFKQDEFGFAEVEVRGRYKQLFDVQSLDRLTNILLSSSIHSFTKCFVSQLDELNDYYASSDLDPDTNIHLYSALKNIKFFNQWQYSIRQKLSIVLDSSNSANSSNRITKDFLGIKINARTENILVEDEIGQFYIFTARSNNEIRIIVDNELSTLNISEQLVPEEFYEFNRCFKFQFFKSISSYEFNSNYVNALELHIRTNVKK